MPHRWASLSDAVRWITRAGGVAVIAHPARYKFTANEEYALFTEFKAHGGRGVEVVTGSHTAAERAKYADTAREFGLPPRAAATSTAPDESHTDLGTLPGLPGGLTPVWGTAGGPHPVTPGVRSNPRAQRATALTRPARIPARHRHWCCCAVCCFATHGHHQQVVGRACRC